MDNTHDALLTFALVIIAWFNEQTLKKLKGKQEENKKREMSRLLSKLEAQDKTTPPMTPSSGPFELMDDSLNPEDTVRYEMMNCKK